MKKFYISNKEELNDQELKTGCVSYRRIIDRYISDLVLCNDIVNLDESIDLNVNNNFYNAGEICQYFLCNLSEFEKDILTDYGMILSYSNILNLDVLLVDHWGTSWDYVMTDVKWTDNWKET